jgi:hypothetical protein
MRYLSGTVHPALLDHPAIGFMLTPDSGYKTPPAPAVWAVDAGTYRSPHFFDLDRYCEWLRNRALADLPRCLFATLPDVPGSDEQTYENSIHCVQDLRELGYPVAWVLQPWATEDSVPWHLIQAVFLGGPDHWQQCEQAHALVRAAQARGLWTHRGRANTIGRLEQTLALGFDSCDGTMVAFEPRVKVPRLLRWMDRLAQQPALL